MLTSTREQMKEIQHYGLFGAIIKENLTYAIETQHSLKKMAALMMMLTKRLNWLENETTTLTFF